VPPADRDVARDLARRFPQFRLPEDCEALYQKDAGVLRSDTAWRGLLRPTTGITISDCTRVLGLRPERDSVLVETSSGSLEFDRVVVAAAGWTNSLLIPLGLTVPMIVTEEHIAYFPLQGADSVPPFIWHVQPGPPHYYGLSGLPGTAKIGNHLSGPQVETEGKGQVEAPRIEELSEFVRRYLPGIDPRPAHSETCLYASTPDDDFILDRRGPIILATGFGGHGFKFAPLVGKMVADLVGGQQILFADRFALSRFESSPETDMDARPKDSAPAVTESPLAT